MSSNSNSDPARRAGPTAAPVDQGDQRRDDTINRLRTALIKDRLAVISLTDENTGTDPYNSGVHRALVKAHVWRKGSR
jgi:hypothetical protein